MGLPVVDAMTCENWKWVAIGLILSQINWLVHSWRRGKRYYWRFWNNENG